jgi:hypothetical protein
MEGEEKRQVACLIIARTLSSILIRFGPHLAPFEKEDIRNAIIYLGFRPPDDGEITNNMPAPSVPYWQ